MRPSLLRNSRTLDGGNEFEAHGLGTEFGLLSLLVAQLVVSETALVEFLTGGNQVEDDASQSVRCGCDGLGSTKLGPHSSVEVAEGAFTVVQRLSRHPERRGRSAVDLSRTHPKDFTGTAPPLSRKLFPGFASKNFDFAGHDVVGLTFRALTVSVAMSPHAGTRQTRLTFEN